MSVMMSVTAFAQSDKEGCAWGDTYSEGSRMCVCAVHRDSHLDKTKHWLIVGIPFVCEDGEWKTSAIPDTGHEKCVDIEYKNLKAAQEALASPVIAAICRQR